MIGGNLFSVDTVIFQCKQCNHSRVNQVNLKCLICLNFLKAYSECPLKWFIYGVVNFFSTVLSTSGLSLGILLA